MRKEMDGQDSKERYTSPEVEKLEAFTDGFVEGIARRHGVPEDNPGKVKDVLEAASQVSFENLPENKLPEGLPGKFIEAAVRVETVAQNLPLNPKQQEFAKGLEENFKGAAGFFSSVGEKAKDFFPKEKGKIVKKAATSLLVAQMALSACGPIVSARTPDEPTIPPPAQTEIYTPTPAEPTPTFTVTPTETLPGPTAIPTEIPIDQIKLDENSFIPTGEYPKDGNDLILLSPQYIGESAKEAVIRNGLGEQASKIEELYKNYIKNNSILSREVNEGFVISFVYAVSSKNSGNGAWTIMPVINNESDVLSVPKVLIPIYLVENPTSTIEFLNQKEILDISNNGTYPENFRLFRLTSPVGFGKNTNLSIFVDSNGYFLLGLPETNGKKPLVWYNEQRIAWQSSADEYVDTEASNLQKNIDFWISSNTPYPDEEKFTDFTDPAPLGLVKETDTMFTFQGLLLGTQVFQDNLIAYFGFEDKNHTHFYIPFDLGNIYSNVYGFDLVRPLRTDLFKGSNYDVNSAFMADAGMVLLKHLEMKPFALRFFPSMSPSTCKLEPIPDYRGVCEEQFMITNSLPTLFGVVNKYGSGNSNNPLVNGFVGENGLELADLPRIGNLILHPQKEPTPDDY